MALTIKHRTSVEDMSFGKALAPLLQRLYASRGISHDDELDYSLRKLLPFDSMLGIDAASARLEKALTQGQRITIIGDFDADGATSTTCAIRALRAFGAEDVHFIVPNRFEYGYGLTPEIVELAAADKPDLLVTVDNGIASVSGVAAANALGIDVVITDHHLPGEQLPDAVAIVNPNQEGCAFPSKNLAGVGVIFYVMCALRRRLIEANWFTAAPPKMTDLLDVVALGTVADVVPLDHNNRLLVQQGLQRIRAGLCQPGITALLQLGKRDPKQLTATDLAFAVAPRLNAAGRLTDMSLGIACLLESDFAAAHEKALQLDSLNQERKAIEAEMKNQAFQALNQLALDPKRDMPAGLALFHEQWHQGVIGILAGRVKEQFHRPVVAFAKVSDDELKGSARSIEGVHIRDVLAMLHAEQPQLMQKFGGHAMAAGLSIKPQHFPAFAQAFTRIITGLVDADMLQAQITTDGPLASDEFNLSMAELIRQAGPWGQHFPEPMFDGQFTIVEQRLVGERHLKLTLAHPESQQKIPAIAFNIDPEIWPDYNIDCLQCVYRLDINEYRDKRTIQLVISDLEPVTQMQAVEAF